VATTRDAHGSADDDLAGAGDDQVVPVAAAELDLDPLDQVDRRDVRETRRSRRARWRRPAGSTATASASRRARRLAGDGHLVDGRAGNRKSRQAATPPEQLGDEGDRQLVVAEVLDAPADDGDSSGGWVIGRGARDDCPETA
jgi:hypothetical protein